MSRALRASLFLAAVLFVLIGWYRGEAKVLFIKATQICLECIGLG
jgi:hypothetical protein